MSEAEVTAAALSALGNLLVAAAAIAAAIAAFLGLNTWKAQIKWQRDHDLARRLLVEIYRFRDAVAAARNPFIWAYEMTPDDGAAPSPRWTEEESHAGEVRAYQKRFSEIASIAPQLYALLLEAEAVWGPELSSKWKKVNRLQNEFTTQTQLYLDYTDPRNKRADLTAFYADKDAVAAAKLIVKAIGEQEGQNDFSNRLAAAIAEVEDYLRPKLERRTQ